MNNLTSIPTPDLARECALRWLLTAEECPDCHGALYMNQALGPLAMGYKRCPSCRINFTQINGITLTDRNADYMLDTLALRTPLISHPRIRYQREHEV